MRRKMLVIWGGPAAAQRTQLSGRLGNNHLFHDASETVYGPLLPQVEPLTEYR